MQTKRTTRTRRQAPRRPARRKALPLRLECLERRDLLSFGSLVQAGLSQSPFTNTSDIAGQSGSVFLNSEVEPYVAVDPTNPKHIVGAWQQDRWSNGGSRGIVAGVSTDGGNTWTDMPIPGATVNSGGTDKRASDPWVSIGPDGRVYVAYLSLPDPNLGNPTALRINASTDGGYTWGAPTAAITNSGDTNVFDDKDSLTADPYTAGEAYVTWDRLNNSANDGPAMFSRTTDGGQTWSTPVVVDNPANGQTIANQLVVLPGDVLVDMAISIDYATNISTIVVMRSTDHGATWSAPTTVNTDGDIGTTDPNNGASVRAGGIIPMIAVDPTSGNVYIVWQDGRFSGNTHDDIALSMSKDGGLTWSSPIKANQTPTNIPTAEQQAFVPTVAVAANGLVGVSYYDFRNDTGSGPTLTDRWVAFANPAQANFSFGNEQRLTDTSFNLQLAPNASGEFLGDYAALVTGGNTTNTFSSFFAQTVSSTTPTAIFYRGIVPPNTLSLTNFAPPSGAVEGASTGGTLATFSDASPQPNLSTYTAVVTWGDGSVDTLTSATGGIVSNGGGSFGVVDRHTYAEESAGESFSVQITDNGGGSAGSSASVAVADAALTASAAIFSATQNSAVNGVKVATFTDADPGRSASDYSATVNWGDSDTTSSVSIVADSQVAGQFDVVASKSHPYAAGGNYSVIVNIADAGGAGATAHSTGIVAEISGTWTPLTNSLIDPYGGETMILLNNGTVMIQGGGGGMSKAWYKLTPDASGSYLNGTWSALASMSIERLYYGSVVLPNGNVVVIGGEYTGPSGTRTLTNTGEVYNPTTNTWSAILADPYNSQLGDVSAMLLPDGNILVGDKLSTQTDIYHPTTNTWSQGGTRLYNDIHDEESWVKLPDNKIISYDVWSSINNGLGQAQIYDPSTNQWTDAGTVPVILSTAATDHEMGPCLRLPDGRVLFIGATGATALYSESTNSWTTGPTMPGGYYFADDAPGALMPNGHVIFVADQGGYNNPSAVFDYDPTANTITQLSTPDGNLPYQPGYVDRMLMLPTGQMLFCDSSNQLLVYTPPGAPQPSWQPVVNSITQNPTGGYTLTGTGLNGVSAGAAYGDDAQMDENFPIVRLTSSTGQVYYATTTNWSYSGVGPGTTETVHFTLPTGMPTGTYTLQDIGAGIASSGTLFNALTLTSFTPPTNVVEGAAAGGTLATFTDANASPNINTYTAVVTWGDGGNDLLTAANGGIVSNGGNSFKVVDSHAYAEESASEAFRVEITDQSGSDLVSSATVTVVDAALTAGALTPPTAVEGQPLSNVTVFHFSDADPAATASDYTAVVTLGDGNTVTLSSSSSPNGQIVAHTGGGFDVQLSYAYAEEMSGKTFSVVVNDSGGATASSTTSSFSVADAALSAGAVTPPTAVEGQAFTNVTVFHFTDADPAGTPGDYSAVVTLGDGNTVTLSSTPSAKGQIVANAGGGFDVQLSYTYGEELSGKTFSVVVSDAGGATASGATSSFSVADAALTAGVLTPPTAIEGQAFSNVTIVHFSDADPSGAVGDYSALVTLGDGNTVTLTSTTSANGQIVAHTGGGFDVQLSYTYAEELSGKTFSALVSDSGGATASATTSSFSVADAALSAGALTPPTAVEGQAFSNVTVFHFNDSDPAGTASDYSALVTLGNGSSVTLTSAASANGQIVANAGGGFDVQLSYTYGEELSGQTFSVVVSDAGGATASGSTSSFSVADAALTAGALAPPIAIEGQALSNVTVVHFSDADPAGTASDYSALVTLGDGNTVTLTSTASANGQIVPHTGGGFDVQLSYTYAEELSGKTFSVVVSDSGGATTSGTTSSFSVADAALSAGALTPPVATEGQAFSNATVFHFSDADLAGAVGDYSALVTLGDGNTVTLTSTASANGQIVAHTGGGFDVQLSHTYAEELSGKTFSVLVSDSGGATASGSTSTLSVADAALTASGLTFNATANSPVTGVTVATFTDADPAGAASDYSATVSWGDGDTTASVSVVADSQVTGRFDVVASKSHPYTTAGSYPVTVNISDAGGATATAQSTAAVSALPITVTGMTITPTEGNAFSGTVASFNDADKTDPVSSYTAKINWGDGSTSLGTVQATGTQGQFTVSGSHTYAEKGTDTITISITDTDGASAQGTSTANVKDAALSGSAVNFTVAHKTPYSGPVATFSDANPSAPVSDFSASVNWGDGQTSTGTVAAVSGGGFQVQATHTYQAKGHYTFTVTITDRDGSTLTITGIATVTGSGGIGSGGGNAVIGGGVSPGVVTGSNSAASSNQPSSSTVTNSSLVTTGSGGVSAPSAAASTQPGTAASSPGVPALIGDNPSVPYDDVTGWLSIDALAS